VWCGECLRRVDLADAGEVYADAAQAGGAEREGPAGAEVAGHGPADAEVVLRQPGDGGAAPALVDRAVAVRLLRGAGEGRVRVELPREYGRGTRHGRRGGGREGGERATRG